MNTWVQVDKLQNAEPVNAETLNRPVDQLASRTEYLKKRLGNILDNGVQSSLVLTDVDLVDDENDPLKVGNIVYRDTDGFKKAQAKMHLYDDYTAADSAFTLGVLISIRGDVGDVLIYGKLDLDGASLITKSNIIQDGETFRSGRYYLSATEAGKITAHPNGPLIYIGSFHSSDTVGDTLAGDAVGYINPQFLDIGTSHVHRAYRLMARPAGSVIGTNVLGYFPVGYTESSDSSSEGSESSFSPEDKYPSLIFGGTWTSVNDVEYVFTLDNSSAWGTVKLKWYKDGNTESYKQVEIPAPDVFVDLDNGLKVKVRFPEATSSNAFTSLSEIERTWVLSFPLAGRGWLNHSVDAVADELNADASSASGEITPSLHAVLSGAWPTYDNYVYGLFPSVAYRKVISDTTSTVVIDDTTYEFVAEGETPEEGNIGVAKAATVPETLYNLAVKANVSAATAYVLYFGNNLIVCDKTLEGYTEQYNGVPTTGFKIVGGTIPLMIVHDEGYRLLDNVITNHSTYTPITVDTLQMYVYAAGATDTNNFVCLPGTRLYVEAYDYAPDAAYDYVMGLHQEVDYYYPPVPAQAAGLFINGVEVENAALFPVNPTYIIGDKTLHWTEYSTGKLPWPDAVHHHDDVIDPSLDKTMAFYFVVGFQCATGPVTSIVAAPGAPIKLYTYGTNDAAATGDLMIDAALDLSVVDAGTAGYKVAKQGSGGKLLAGPVVERIKAGNGIVVTQSAGCPSGQGTVTIGLDNGSIRGQFNEIALENAKQEKIGLFPYVSLLGWGESNNIPSAFTTMVRIPSNLEVKDYQLQLRLVMFGTVAYSSVVQKAAGVQLEYNILPDYTDKTNLSLKTGLLVPDNPRQIAVPLGHKVGTNWEYTAYDPFVATTDASMTKESDVCVSFSDLPIPTAAEFSTKVPKLQPGYLLAIRLSRITTPDLQTYSAYTGPLGFISMEWTLEEA